MKERPILFSTEMVRAILDGRKTQTRRLVHKIDGPKAWDSSDETGWPLHKDGRGRVACPFGVPGDRLWVKETWWMHDDLAAFPPGDGNVSDPEGRKRVVGYAASMDYDSVRVATEYGARKRPSIHMPRWASRITLEVTGVRVDRLHEIGRDGRKARDVLAEGITREQINHMQTWFHPDDSPAMAYRALWNKINGDNGPASWEANPWVWVVEFKKQESPK